MEAGDSMLTAIEPVVLEGRWVRLEPLSTLHEAALAILAQDDEIGRYMASSPAEFLSWLAHIYERAARHEQVPFAIVERATSAVAGFTRYMDIQLAHHSVEIGGTWLGRAWWGTGLNREAKYLMLRHLFEVVGCQRVWLKADRLNTRSQRAIEALGAVREGILRKHMIVGDGRTRDSVIYSIIDDEWPAVRQALAVKLYGAYE
jgi:RimJ/RimL family protein N-acetyltransferase